VEGAKLVGVLLGSKLGDALGAADGVIVDG